MSAPSVNSRFPQVPYQTDYLFVSEKLSRRLRKVEILNEDDSPVWELSDHCPIVATLEV
jgi:exonuclease III